MALFRSALFVPGHRERMLAKALGTAADCLYFDLEDSVPDSEKATARAATARTLGDVRSQAARVRINGLATPHTLDDIDAVVGPGLGGVVIPKVENAVSVEIVDYLLGAVERRASVPHGTVRITASLETAAGVANCREVVRASSRVDSVLVGVAEDGDLQRDLGYKTSDERSELLYVLGHVLVEARAAGIRDLVAGPYVRLDDPEGLERDATFVRGLGFTAKAAIHPGQLETINRVFSPTPAELEYYRRVAEAVREAHAQGLGAATVDGRMVDQAMLERAESVIERAKG